MSQSNAAEIDRIAVTADRLRRVQADFVGLDPDLLRQFLAEELGRALSLLESSQRQSFVHKLQERHEAASHSAGQIAGQSAGHSANEASPDDKPLIELFDSTLSELQAERQHSDTESALNEAAAIQQLCGALGIAGGVVDPVHAIAMATMLANFSTNMTNLAWMAWRTIAPNSSVRRGGMSQKLFARYVAGDPAVSREQVAGELERLRQLIAALISAISQVGEQFARNHLEKFAPAEIEQAVASEGRRGLLSSREAQCWRKYVQLSDTLDQTAIESEIRRVIAQHAEHLLRGISRP